MISAPSRSTTGRWLGEIERDDRDILGQDVVPDVELGPVREREHAHRFAGPDAGVEQVPQLRPLVARVPGMACASGARRSAPWRGSSPRRAARRRRRHRTCARRAPAAALRSS